MAERRRKFWGWGYEDQGPNPEQQKRIAERMAARFGLGELTIVPPPRVEDLNLRAPRVKPPDSLAAICLSDTYERAFHSYGRGFRDIVRAFRRYYPNPVDVVAYPRSESDVVRILEWCDGASLAAIPFGGGSSVVGGLEAPAGGDYRGAVTIDLRYLDKVIEVDKHVSRGANPGGRARTGAGGPAPPARLYAPPFPAIVRVLRVWADGSRPAPAATSRPITRISTISSSRFGS